MADERGETKTDADGNVNTDELETYNPMKYPHQKDAQVAPSTTKEIDSRGLYKPFSQSANEPKKINNPTEALPKEIYAKMDNEDSDAGEMDYLSSTDGSIKYGIAKEGDKYYVTLGTEEGEILKSFGKTKDAGEAAQIFMKNLDAVKSKYNLDVDSNEPKAEPAKKRPGNPTVNKEAKKNAEKFGITPQKLGNDVYKKAMYQAVVEALTDANFHDEARELISKIEGKPEWAKRVDYPKMDDPKYKEKMADIRTNGVDSSEYWGSEGNAHELGRNVASSAGWGGVEAADGIAFTLRMNGFHKEADLIQSVFDNKPYMKNEGMIKLANLLENDPCWKGYKQVGMKDKNGKEVPNCVPEGVVKEAGIPKLYLKIEAVKNKIKALEAERKSKYGGEYARKLNAETDPKRKHELAQPIFAITKQITMYQKNLLKMMDDEEKYYANMGKDDELDPNFA
jgi:hypothetical protein